MTKLLVKAFIKNADDVSNPKVREKYGILSGFVGVLCNILLSVVKFIVGIVTNSISITADAANNLSDASSSIITLVGTKISSKPADKEHPFGHGRSEYITALIISFIILIMGFELGKSSFEKVLNPSPVEFNLVAVILIILAIPVKLWMAYFNNKLYKKTKNLSMKAMCKDSLNDCIATSATIIALLVSSLTKYNIDGYIGLVVAVIILIAGFNMIKEIVAPLLGKAPDERTVKQIKEIILSHEMVIGVHDLLVHDYGPNRIIASAHAEVPSSVDIMKIHDEIDNIEMEIHEKLRILTVIHMDPLIVDDEKITFLKERSEKILADINVDFSFHDFRVVAGPTHTNIIFDLIVPYDYTVPHSELKKVIDNKFKEIDSTYNTVITIEHDYTL